MLKKIARIHILTLFNEHKKRCIFVSTYLKSINNQLIITHIITYRNKTKRVENSVNILQYKMCIKSAYYLHQKSPNWALNMVRLMLLC